jgi:hypothetical protein
LLGGRFVPGLSELDSQRQILAYALVFGYAQQLLSRLIDNRAHTILNSLPSKGTDANRFTPQPASLIVAAPPPGRRGTVNQTRRLARKPIRSRGL